MIFREMLDYSLWDFESCFMLSLFKLNEEIQGNCPYTLGRKFERIHTYIRRQGLEEILNFECSSLSNHRYLGAF